MRIYQSVSLVGIMGAGKTCIAKKLAKKLDLYHIDTDKEIKTKTGLSVKQLIDTEQSDLLKTVEFEIIKEHCHKKCVVSTGDHTVNNQKAWDYLMQNSLSVWINLSLVQILQRLKPSENRPFFPTELTLQHLKEIYNERKKKYFLSKIQIRSLNASKVEDLLKIIQHFLSESIVI
ncbi:shikimate kinase [Alphaproteobacteria bacterium endosymbiont of Tiliacea citrago]|uniref:shikimate kinase n=1 Tax=Alphaproteobacteria bacterium endosymbiont of Tiliacea citrago TaxID=3077944 RepID=UPI00313D912E